MRDLESPYRRRDESILVEMKLNRAAQLFHSLDPSPFHEKDPRELYRERATLRVEVRPTG